MSVESILNRGSEDTRVDVSPSLPPRMHLDRDAGPGAMAGGAKLAGGETLDFASQVRGGRLAVSAVVKGEGVLEEQSLQGGETLDFASEVRGGRPAVSAVVKGEGV